MPKIFRELPDYQEALGRGEWERAFSLLTARAGSQAGPSLPPKEAFALASLHSFRGDVPAAVAILKELEDHADRHVAGEAMLQLAGLRLSTRTASLEEVEALIERMAPIAEGNQRLKGLLAHARSRILWRRSKFQEAGEKLKEARLILEEVGDEEELAKVLDSLAMYHEHCAEREKALTAYSLSLSKKALWRDLYGLGITLGNLGRFHLRMKEPQAAYSFLSDDLRIATRIGDLWAQVVVKINLGQALTELKRLDEAEKELGEALFLARGRGWRQQEIFALKDLARVVGLKGDRERAFVLLNGALELVPEDPPNYARGQVLLIRGELFLESSEHEKAREAFGEARKCFVRVGAKQEEASAIEGLARVSEKLQLWNDYLQLLDDGKNCLNVATIASRFEDTMQVGSSDRFVPRNIGHYRILTRIGGGSYGDVYKGFDGRPDASRNDVAIKVLRMEGVRSESEREERILRFRRECEILSRISHRHVVRLIDSGEEPLPYLVQEYVAGGDLHSFLQEDRALAYEKALPLIKGMIEGLIVLHEKGVVHRDLKPGNVLVRQNGEPVIADFGIARMVDLTALTVQSMIMGTLGYMSPEQIRGRDVDERTDIYAMGVIFFQMFAGKLPYPENTLQEILTTIEAGNPPDLALLRPDLPPTLALIIRRCMQKAPDDRFPTARALLAAIN